MSLPDISETQVLHLLRDTLGLDVGSITVLRPGAWSRAFAFAQENDEFVIRFSHHGEDLDRDEYATRFATDSCPIPRVTHRGTKESIHYAISERVSGGFIDDLSSEDLRRTLPSLLAALDALRTADVSASSGYGGWDAHGNGTDTSWPVFLRTTLNDSPEYRGGPWRPKLESSPGGSNAFDRDLLVFERLVRNMPNVRNVLHSDLINYNAFVEDFHISGIIDWGCAMYGDFVYELAWFSFWSPWYPQWKGADIALEGYSYFQERGADMSAFKERLICYELYIGLSHQAYNASIGRWDDLADVVRHTTTIADKVR